MTPTEGQLGKTVQQEHDRMARLPGLQHPHVQTGSGLDEFFRKPNMGGHCAECIHLLEYILEDFLFVRAHGGFKAA
jgi:hypothetical protein